LILNLAISFITKRLRDKEITFNDLLMTPHQHTHSQEPAWVHGHAHEPNPAPPSPETAFTVQLPNGNLSSWDVADLEQLATTTVRDCYIVSTGHGTSGPFTFTGVRLQDFLTHVLDQGASWQHLDVVSSDGFGTRLTATDLAQEATDRPSLLVHTLHGQPLTRAQGLVRLIVPTETDDALRQVKWVARIVIYADQ
jgi:DMSO/TMAO reductase YedYZ molybdopterin-dependent catalytic subunit